MSLVFSGTSTNFQTLLKVPFFLSAKKKNSLRRERIRKKLEDGTASRLQLDKYRKQLPKINRELAKRLLHGREDEEEGDKEASAADGFDAADDEAKEFSAETSAAAEVEGKNPLGDDRFAALFTNPDFEIDFDSREYRRLHPHANAKRGVSDLLQEKFSAIPDDEDDEAMNGDEKDSNADSETEEDCLAFVAGQLTSKERERQEKEKKALAQERQEYRKDKEAKKAAKRQGAAGPKLFELNEGQQFRALASLREQPRKAVHSKTKSFGSLVRAAQESEPKVRSAVNLSTGGKLITFEVGEEGRQKKD